MTLAQAISDATNSSDLSWAAAVALYLGIPLAVTALIFTLVFSLSRSGRHDGSQVLGHPAELSRQERDEQPPVAHRSGPPVEVGADPEPSRDAGRTSDPKP